MTTYTVYYTVYDMQSKFGAYVRQVRESLRAVDPNFSVRKVAARVGVQPAFLSKVERGEQGPPSEAKIVALAEVLGEDPDVLLALAGKVSGDLQQVICERPRLFSKLIRELKRAPDTQIEGLVREVRDGKW